MESFGNSDGVPGSVLNLQNAPRMLDMVRAGLRGATSVRIAVAFTRCSGLGLILDGLVGVLERGGSVHLLTSTYQYVTQPEALEALLLVRGIQVKVQDGSLGFHAKFWWFGEENGGECWAGSSNLTKGGLDTNLEWNFRHVEPGFVRDTRAQFDRLWVRPDAHALTEGFVRDYGQRFLSAALPNRPKIHFAADIGEVVSPNEAQREALESLARLRDGGERRAAIIAATGVGKTFLAAFDMQQAGAKKGLYVSHRLEHLLQAMRAFSRVFRGELTTGLVGGGYAHPEADIVFVTVASLKNRPGLLDKGWDYLVVDEFHHVEAPSYEVLRSIRERAFLLGITATPERQDGHDVLEWCDWNVAYEVRLPEAIERGWLLPFHYFGIADETVDFLKIPWRRLEEVEDALSVEGRALHILSHAKKRGFDGLRRATIGFCVGRKHALFMADAFQRNGETAVVVLGDQSVHERERIYRQLADPEHALEWVFVADVLNEGVDIPEINSILFLRPTKSATVFLQQLGRGLRLTEHTEVLTVLDFVGHHRAAWLTLDAIHAPDGSGRRTEVASGYVVQPPKSCEVVLERRTQEILAKVSRFTSKREQCNEAYSRLKGELGRPVRPVDIWNRQDVPGLRVFRSAFKTWLQCQEANDDLPSWVTEATADVSTRGFLKAMESDWQAQRVWPYALAWALCAFPKDVEVGYAEFYQRWPRWRVESHERAIPEGAWRTVERKLGDYLDERRVREGIQVALGAALLPEVEGRLLYTIASDYKTRHGGVLRTPGDLNLFARYGRPAIIRHFGVHFDPAKHNKGVTWFGSDGVLITKLNTSGAKAVHQYNNAFLDDSRFSWTSQNQMRQDNRSGLRVLNHEKEGTRLHLFVQPNSHRAACYLGQVQVSGVRGTGPMVVEFTLPKPIPPEVRAELK